MVFRSPVLIGFSKSENNKRQLTHASIFLGKTENLQDYTHRRGQRQTQKLIKISDRWFDPDSEEKQQPWQELKFWKLGVPDNSVVKFLQGPFLGQLKFKTPIWSFFMRLKHLFWGRKV